MSRQAVQQEFSQLQSDIERLPTDDWNAVRTKLDHAQVKAMFAPLAPDIEATLATLQNKDN